MQVLHEIHAAHDRCAQLPVRGEDPVRFLQREGASDLRRLLADQRGIDGQFPLTLEGCRLQVRPAGQCHQPVQLSELFVLEAEGGQVRFGLSFGRNHAEGTLRCFRRRPLRHYAVLGRASRH